MKLFSSRATDLSQSHACPGLPILAAVALCATTLGCGLAASPQPPSLHLPTPVRHLTAARAGDQVALHWDTPKETTDRLRIHTPVKLRICRQPHGEPCATVATVSAAPGKPADYTDTPPAPLTHGPLRPMDYEIFGLNQHNRTAGPSNAATTMAGEAPPPVQDLSATEIERGVVLHWRPLPGLSPNMSIQLQRNLLTTPIIAKTGRLPGQLSLVSEPAHLTLQVPPQPDQADPGTALDPSVEFNRKYQYVAVRIRQVTVGTQPVQIASAPSNPVVIVTRDTFPPAAPSGLAAIPVPASLNHGAPEVDLSWSPNTEPDLAHYIVYRREVASNQSAHPIGPINAAAPIVAPTFRDPHVQPGETYAYSVAAVDNAGNQSPPSAEVVVTIPGP